ncbi:hypothetical protein D3C84_794360 [compost metagenome]
MLGASAVGANVMSEKGRLSFLFLDDNGSSAITEQDAGGAVVVIRNLGQAIAADHENLVMQASGD